MQMSNIPSGAEQVKQLLDEQKNDLLEISGRLRARAGDLQRRQDRLDRRIRQLEILRELEVLRLLEVQAKVRQMQDRAKLIPPSNATIEELKQYVSGLRARSGHFRTIMWNSTT
jgi:mRNA-degrading endonuclease RelE of RelBE toxin-antitoxin system